MLLIERIDFPAAPDAVFAMLVDRAFREEVCAQTGALSWSVEIDRSGDGASVTVRRVMPSDVPAAMKRFLGETLEVVQTEQWESADGDHRRSEVLVEIVGQPAKMIGTETLDSAEGGSVLVVEGDVKVSIPLLGGKIENEVAGAIRAALAVEQRVGNAYLSA